MSDNRSLIGGRRDDESLRDSSLYTVSSNRPRGDELFQQRVSAIEKILPSYLETPIEKIRDARAHIVAVGLGSSKAHAQFLQHLINQYTDHTCTVASPTDFIGAQRPTVEGKTIALFSQGLSQNSHPTLRVMIEQGHGVLLTATDVSDESVGQQKRDILRAALEKGIDRVSFPIASEYEILARVVGPFFGYVAAYRFVSESLNSRLPKVSLDQLLPVFVGAEEAGRQLAERVGLTEKQIKIVTLPPTNQYAHNLAEKIKEGLFLPRPELVDLLEFDHGAFQNACALGSHTIILSHHGAEDSVVQALKRITNSSKEVSIPEPVIISASQDVRPELRILFYEMAFNHWVAKQLESSEVDQVRWPGKGHEPNYSLS
ncbi:MAG: hypothetical protein RL326_1383 [Pseudomonadota bacterium]